MRGILLTLSTMKYRIVLLMLVLCYIPKVFLQHLTACESERITRSVHHQSFIPKCKFDGSYQNLQCCGITRNCWRVDPKTGKEIVGTRKRPGERQADCDAQQIPSLPPTVQPSFKDAQQIPSLPPTVQPSFKEHIVDNIDGGGWILVRHVPAGHKWHTATDQLRGTDKYETPCGETCSVAWSIPFNHINFNQFLFATGDGSKWLIANKRAVTGGYYRNKPRLIYMSSIQKTSYKARWYRRRTHSEDPWISLEDHRPASLKENILYGENRGSHASEILLNHNGANVYIRKRNVEKSRLNKEWKPMITSVKVIIGVLIVFVIAKVLWVRICGQKKNCHAANAVHMQDVSSERDTIPSQVESNNTDGINYPANSHHHHDTAAPIYVISGDYGSTFPPTPPPTYYALYPGPVSVPPPDMMYKDGVTHASLGISAPPNVEKDFH